jgi:predicted small secreted protein
MVRKLAALAAPAGRAAWLAGRNTIEGIVQDLQAGGKAIDRAADRSKPS